MSDRDSVVKVLAGDPDAFAALYRAHVHAVVAAVRDHVADRESVADTVQEVFTRALDGLRALREPDQFRPWLLAIARHAAVDQQRREIRERLSTVPAANSPEELSPDGDPADIAQLRAESALVAGCVAGLSRRDATALAMVAHLGFSPAEVASALGVTPGTAKVIVHRARRRLRGALALELGVRRAAGSCPTFEQLYGRDNVVAARHVSDCHECHRAMQDEVTCYAMPVHGNPPTAVPV